MKRNDLWLNVKGNYIYCIYILKIMCMKCKCPALLNNRAVSICEKYNLEPIKCCLDCENFYYIKG